MNNKFQNEINKKLRKTYIFIQKIVLKVFAKFLNYFLFLIRNL